VARGGPGRRACHHPAIELRPLTAADVDDVHDLVQDPDTLRFTRIPEPPPDGFARQWYARYQQGRETSSKEAFAIVGDDGAFLGLALAPSIDAEAAEAELGYIVAAHARGRGVASEALRQLTAWAFEERGTQRAYLLIDVDNAASGKVAERAGYRLEGVMRSTYLKQGRRGDTQLWARLVSDPAPNTCSL
jgi:RimJ/RimL family protein N-acetyltransferase